MFMKSKRRILTLGIRASLTGLAMLILVLSGWPGGTSTRADNTHFNPPFDFSDSFYRQNGIDPSKLIIRMGTPTRPQTAWVLDNTNTDPMKNNIRALETASAFDIDGNLTFFNVIAVLDPSAFTNNPAGVRARTIADSFRAFFFPKTPRNPDGSPGPVSLDFGITNRRQDNTFETKNTYFCQNLVGFWVADFVVYTKKAFSRAGQAILAPIADRNGRDADGTPILKRVEEVDSLTAQGLGEIRQNPFTGGAGTRWLICPDIMDPRKGAIRTDAFLLSATTTGGSDVIPSFRSNFVCLQNTGKFCTCRTQFCAE
jgi:hypothetical protein